MTEWDGADNTYDPAKKAQIDQLIEELGVSTEERIALIRASNTTPESIKGVYSAWLKGEAPGRPISQDRMIALLQMRKQRAEPKDER